MNIMLFTNTAHVTRYVLGCRHPLLSSFFDHPLKTRGVFFVVGLCRTVVQILILFQTKKVIFHTRRQTWRRQKLCHYYLD